MRKNTFDLDDYLNIMKKVRKMGSFKQILGMMPGIPNEIKNAEIDEKQLYRIDAIITSMTKEERRNPKILNSKRRIRIADGSGNRVEDVNRFMNQFEQMQKMMKSLNGSKGKNKFRNLKNMIK